MGGVRKLHNEHRAADLGEIGTRQGHEALIHEMTDGLRGGISTHPNPTRKRPPVKRP